MDEVQLYDHERARDARLKNIEKLYQGYKDQLDALTSERSDTSGPHDHLSLILGHEHSGRIRCRLRHTSTSYWSEVSISLQTFNIVSGKELEVALAWVDHAVMQADQAEERASHLEGIVRDMVLMLNAYFGGTFMGFEDMLARIPTAAPPTLAAAPALAPARTPCPRDDDDVDLGDF
ncbi:hypothetical protein COCNU_scaffold006899G000020 [Cocos nucifera]|nr:hypothetical protein [Cocos nucifera]